MVIVTERKDRPGRRRVQFKTDNPSKTEQCHKEACDVNRIVARIRPQPVYGRVVPGKFGDFTGVGSFQECVQRITQMKQEFAALPAHLRKRFDNSPQKLVDFLGNEQNREEAIRLGLVDPPARPAKVEAPPVATPPQQAAGASDGPPQGQPG